MNIHTAVCAEQARTEWDQALLLAWTYRNVVEDTINEKQVLKQQLKTKVKMVSDFRQNKIVEGSSTSGKLLRAALIRE